MITKIQMSPNLGAFHVEVSINSWEIPGRELLLNPQCFITNFLVDDGEGFLMPRKGSSLDMYNLPPGHRYNFNYQLYIDPQRPWLFIRDDGSFLPLFGEDIPPIRYTEVIIPEDFVVISTHELEKVQHKKGLLRFIFRGENGPVFSIARYYVDRIFSGEIYLLKKEPEVELLSLVLRRAWDYMRNLCGDGAFPGPLRYVVLPQGETAFELDGSFFFPWPNKGSLRGFEDILRVYLRLGWTVGAYEAEEFFNEGFVLFFTSKIIKNIYSPGEIEGFNDDYKQGRDRVRGKSLKELKGRDLSLGGWMLLEELEEFLQPEIFYPVMKLFLNKHREKPTDLEHFFECFVGLSWKEGTKEFLQGRIFGGVN